jgi:hypothetical protein
MDPARRRCGAGRSLVLRGVERGDARGDSAAARGRARGRRDHCAPSRPSLRPQNFKSQMAPVLDHYSQLGKVRGWIHAS